MLSYYNSYCGCQHASKAWTEETSKTKATSLQTTESSFQRQCFYCSHSQSQYEIHIFFLYNVPKC